MTTPNAAIIVLDQTVLDLLPSDRAAAVQKAMTDVADLRKAIDDRVVVTEADVHELNKDIQLARDAAKKLETARVESVSPLNGQVKSINALFGAVIKPLEAIVSAGDAKFRTWQRAEAEKRRAAQEEHDRKIREAADAERRRREEADRLAREAAAKNVTPLVPAEDQAKNALAAMGVTPEQMAAAQIPPPPPPITGVRTAGWGSTSIVKRWTVEVVDHVAAVSKHPELFDFRKADALKIREQLGATNEDGQVVDGLKFYKTDGTSHR